MTDGQDIETAGGLLSEALELLNDRPNFGLRHDAGRTSYKLAARIGDYMRSGRPFVELSAVRPAGDNSLETCNGEPESADRFGVYICAPLAFHVQDFEIADYARPSEAKAQAFAYAEALAEHIGAAFDPRVER